MAQTLQMSPLNNKKEVAAPAAASATAPTATKVRHLEEKVAAANGSVAAMPAAQLQQVVATMVHH
jgi:hypothetical protein